MDEKKIADITLYTLKLIDQTISPKEFDELNSIISSNVEAARYYNQLMMTVCNFQEIGQELFFEDSMTNNAVQKELWKSLAEYEKAAPVVKITPPQEANVLIQKIDRKISISKGSLFTLFATAAAVILIFVFAYFAPQATGIKVGILSDSINAKWADMNSAMEKDAPVFTSRENFLLRGGIIELLFDSRARVIIEAPAEFALLSADQIRLEYGRMYAKVPREAIGFTVNTQTARIIDLGTEFGVSADISGDTSLYVMRGRTTLIAGEKSSEVSMEIGAGQAKRVSGITQIISDITFHENLFVRNIDSIKNTIWKGQTGIDLAEIDLADIVRNGNGLGTGNSQVRLNYIKGFTTDQRGGETLIAKDFLPIKDPPFIDGIFIPDERTVVSSRGDVFEEFLKTSGVHCADLFGNPVPGSFFLNEQRHTIQFDGQEYSERGKSCIFMPGSNHGITFDLDAIRNCYNLKIDRFTSRVGLADFDNKRCNANFYVLVDGQLRYSLLGYTQKGVLNDVSVKLEDTDRFLTLATTENVDQRDYMVYSTLHDNWCVFTEPVLMLE